MNGIIGYGLNNQADCEQFITDCADLLNQKGFLLIGVNPNQMGNVNLVALKILQARFVPIAMDGYNQKIRIQNEFFKNIFHDYCFFSRKP
ncbi:MAG: hypothetical protein H7328_01360 [Bdellovibrio sp.]|nr:hypothetical protein [Bdellovibrio sp.]